MSELKPRITENGIDYILVGDYYIPDLKLPEEHRPIGKYGRMHRELYWSSFLVTLCSEIMLYIETPLVSYSYSLNEVSHSCTS